MAMVSLSGSAAAQTWQAVGNTSGNGTGSYWNNTSDDQLNGGPCNIGSLVAGTAIPANCLRQNPTSLLPLNLPNQPYAFLGGVGGSVTPFYFGAGQWEVTVIGTMAGANPIRTWQAVDGLSSSVLATNAANGVSQLITAGGNGFFLNISAFAPAGNLYTSNALNADGNSQFSVFTAASGLGAPGAGGLIGNTADGRSYFVGIEDNACGPNVEVCRGADGLISASSDRDYQDIIIQIRAVPEPSTVVLLGFGLAATLAAARRRRNA